MTVDELTKHFNETFGCKTWPKTFEVDHKTYANVCQFIFTNCMNKGHELVLYHDEYNTIRIAIGPFKDGIMFKNVELILKDERK